MKLLIGQVVECLPIVQETGVQSQVESYQRLKKKWYLIPPCFTLSIIRYVSRVKWTNPGKGVAPSPIPHCSSYWKGSFQVALNYNRRQQQLLQIFKTMEKSEFHVLIKHCFLMGKNTVQAKQWLDKCYSDSALLETMVNRWYADFNHIDTNDAECSGHPNSAVVPENTKKLHKLIFADHKLKLHEIAEELKITEGSIFTILHEHLSMRKLYSKWVLHLLTVNQKQHQWFRALFATVSMQLKGIFV